MGAIRRHIAVDYRWVVWWINEIGYFVTYDVYNVSEKRTKTFGFHVLMYINFYL